MIEYLLESESMLSRSSFSSSLAHLWRCRDTICSNCSHPFITFCHGRSIAELLTTCTPATNQRHTKLFVLHWLIWLVFFFFFTPRSRRGSFSLVITSTVILHSSLSAASHTVSGRLHPHWSVMSSIHRSFSLLLSVILHCNTTHTLPPCMLSWCMGTFSAGTRVCCCVF